MNTISTTLVSQNFSNLIKRLQSRKAVALITKDVTRAVVLDPDTFNQMKTVIEAYYLCNNEYLDDADLKALETLRKNIK